MLNLEIQLWYKFSSAITTLPVTGWMQVLKLKSCTFLFIVDMLFGVIVLDKGPMQCKDIICIDQTFLQ